MTNRLEIHGLDLTAMGIGDVDRVSDGVGFEAFLNDFARNLLGSITFGPVISITNDEFNSLLYNPEDIDDDEDWEYAE